MASPPQPEAAAKALALQDAPFVYTKIGKTRPMRRKGTSIVQCAADLFTGSWMRTGDASSKSLRDQLLMEQTNIALVAALFLTMSVGMLVLADRGNDWTDDWKKGVFGAILNVSNSFTTMSVILSVFVMLSINECKDEAELRRFDGHMGFLVQLPLLLFLVGVCIFGFFGCGFWSYINFDLDWFIGISVGSYSVCTFVLTPAVLKTLQMLYKAKDDRFGTVVIANDEVPRALAGCVAADGMGGECVDMEAFAEYVSLVCRAETIAPLTLLRMQTALESWQQEAIRAQKKLPTDLVTDEI